MGAVNNGGPAFPDSVAVGPAGDLYGSTGMTLRDYFAGKELAKVDGVHICDIEGAYDHLAEHCYRMADAMLRERAKYSPSAL